MHSELARLHLSALVLSFLVFLLRGATSQHVLDLGTASWTVTSPSLNISIPGSFPSHVHLDLQAAQVIGDPYFGLNDFKLRWIAASNWTYRANVTGLKPTTLYSTLCNPLDSACAVGHHRRSDLSTWLLFQGLDTFTSIDLCGYHVASTNNQFRQYYFDVTPIVLQCDDIAPELSINFGSAPDIVDEIASQPNQQTWPHGVQQVFEYPNRHFMRKEQNDFGWDWGPAFAPAGPWLPAYAIQLEPTEIYIRNSIVDVYRLGQVNNRRPDQRQPWVLNASMDFIGILRPDPYVSSTLSDSKGHIMYNGTLNNLTIREDSITGSILIEDGSVELWWPHDLGKQTMYTLNLQVNSEWGCETPAMVSKRIGFRTIVLNQEEVTKEEISAGVAPGNNWHFEINGRPFFAKGSNFIPPDAFWPRVTEDRIRSLLEAVVAGNQNMLRIWSSGAYSPDFMYDIADELGVLLWSEFEFGDSLYPVDQEFLDNVYEEATYQVRRINHHPSLAFWAGGNELENLELYLLNVSLIGLNRSAQVEEYIRYKNQYEKLFLSTLFPAVFENSRSISYSPSSTSNGYISLNFTDAPYFHQRYESLEEGSLYGVSDYYNYDSTYAFNYSTYPVARFSNEFGYHSMPSIQTWRTALDPEDLHFNSSTIQLRNHHYPAGNLSLDYFFPSIIGMGEMTMAAQRWYPVPNKTDPTANFSSWCHVTQVFQADFYASQIQFYRRGSGQRQRTLGSLYWQLEDLWQAPTWSSIEHGGRWKVLHYRAADAYKNVIISPFYDANTTMLEVWVTSDLWDAAEGSVRMTWMDWNGNVLDDIRALLNLEFKAKVGPLTSTKLFGETLQSLLGETYDPKDVVVRLSVTMHGNLPNSKQRRVFAHESWFHAAKLSEANIVDPGLELEFDNGTERFSVVASKGVAAWVWLDYPEGAVVEFEDNGFWLAKGERRDVGYRVKEDTTSGKWRKGVTVESIWDNTQP